MTAHTKRTRALRALRTAAEVWGKTLNVPYANDPHDRFFREIDRKLQRAAIRFAEADKQARLEGSDAPS